MSYNEELRIEKYLTKKYKSSKTLKNSSWEDNNPTVNIDSSYMEVYHGNKEFSVVIEEFPNCCAVGVLNSMSIEGFSIEDCAYFLKQLQSAEKNEVTTLQYAATKEQKNVINVLKAAGFEKIATTFSRHNHKLPIYIYQKVIRKRTDSHNHN